MVTTNNLRANFLLLECSPLSRANRDQTLRVDAAVPRDEIIVPAGCNVGHGSSRPGVARRHKLQLVSIGYDLQVREMLPGAVWLGIPRDENGNGLSCKELLSKSRIDFETVFGSVSVVLQPLAKSAELIETQMGNHLDKISRIRDCDM